MKQTVNIILIISFLIALLSKNTHAQENNKFALDFYPIPLLLGELSVEGNIPMGKTALGIQATYYNPSLLLSGVLIRSQLGPGDELNMNVHSVIPGFSFCFYSKGGAKGFYTGGSFLYKIALGDVLYKDKYTGGRAYKGIVESDLDIMSFDIGARAGYRFVFNNGFSIRLGARLGYQTVLKNNVTYTIIEDYDDEGDEVIEDLDEAIERYTKKFTQPITFQVDIGLGLTF